MGGIVRAIVNVVSTVFGGGEQQQQQQAAAPTVAPVTPMPTADDAAVADAKKKSIAAITARQGRASTILTGNSDPSGGGSGTLGG